MPQIAIPILIPLKNTVKKKCVTVRIFEGTQCLGYVGAGVYASRLMDVLLGLNIEGLPNSEYVFLNVDTGTYLYHQDEALLNTQTTDRGYLEILQRIRDNSSTQAGTYSYVDEQGVDQLAVYKYLKDRNWVFMVRDNEAEVYGSVMTVRITVGILCAVVAAAIILVTLFILYREGRELMVMESAIGRLGRLELSADRDLEAFYGRTDEIGMIAQTIHHVCDCLRKTIDDIGRILGEMADGNIAVDVEKNKDYYVGDFRVLAESLKSIRTHLTDVMQNIANIANQVNSGANQVSAGAQALSQGAIEQKESINGLVANVTDITAQIQNSTVRCSNASGLVDRATGYAAEAAGNTSALIGRSIDDVKTGTQSTNDAISAMHVIGECIESIKTLMDEIAAASNQQAEMIVSVENRIREVSTVIQTNSDAARTSAEISNELSGQAKTLNSLIGQFHIG